MLTHKIFSLLLLVAGFIYMLYGSISTADNITGAVTGSGVVDINIFIGLFFIIASAAVLAIGFYKNNI